MKTFELGGKSLSLSVCLNIRSLRFVKKVKLQGEDEMFSSFRHVHCLRNSFYEDRACSLAAMQAVATVESNFFFSGRDKIIW